MGEPSYPSYETFQWPAQRFDLFKAMQAYLREKLKKDPSKHDVATESVRWAEGAPADNRLAAELKHRDVHQVLTSIEDHGSKWWRQPSGTKGQESGSSSCIREVRALSGDRPADSVASQVPNHPTETDASRVPVAKTIPPRASEGTPAQGMARDSSRPLTASLPSRAPADTANRDLVTLAGSATPTSTALPQPTPRNGLIKGLSRVTGKENHLTKYQEMKKGAIGRYYALWTHDWRPDADYWEKECDLLLKRAGDPDYDEFEARRIISKSVIEEPHYRVSVQLHDRVMQRAMDWGIYQVRVLGGLKSFEMMLTDCTRGERPAHQILLTPNPTYESLLFESDAETGEPIASIGRALEEVFNHLWESAKSRPSPPPKIDYWQDRKAVERYFEKADHEATGVLKQYEDLEESAVIQLLQGMSEGQSRRVVVCEMGSGAGRFQRILARQPSVAKVFGADYSKPMLRVWERYARTLTGRKRESLTREERRKIKCFRANMLDPSKGFVDNLPSDFPGPHALMCCVLNTLGVLRSWDDRLQALKTMAAVGGLGSRLFVSVLNGDRFDENYPHLYGSLSEFVGPKENWSDPNGSKNFTTHDGYFSHWFEGGEIRRLVRNAGYKEIKLNELGDPAVGFAVTARVL